MYHHSHYKFNYYSASDMDRFNRLFNFCFNDSYSVYQFVFYNIFPSFIRRHKSYYFSYCFDRNSIITMDIQG